MNGANMSVKPAQRPERGFAKTRRRTAAYRPAATRAAGVARAAGAATPPLAAALHAAAAHAQAHAAQPAALPLAYVFDSAGPAARPVLILGWALLALCTSVCVVIAVLLALALFRRRAATAGLTERGGLGFVYIGSAISTALLLAALVYMLWVLAAVAKPPRPPAVTIAVTAYDWWWKADYGGGPPDGFTTANELHVPVGEPVLIELRSADVIHAFWAPQLAGKTQAIPGQINRQWMQADRPGVYRGQCTQFCGAQHAQMGFEIVAEPPDAYRRWYASQRRGAEAPRTADALRGQRIFADRCAGCHAVRGTGAAGTQAPDLTHVGARRLLAAGALANTPDELRRWIADAQQVKPQSLMPSIRLDPAQQRDLSAYLATLR
ncbi:cytochrome c oxidase subunit II [Burkholderia pseudomallei TSV44]|uniref:cytochrome c oxidase subunit II n=1 Tax=Burkholderia pseudomallei TaxID=28450 RepID=UPI00052A1358|nr:cytochrome c oxidase subunit II [Burkholderia pseudomallei]AIV62561.1 cytochrome c oxidase, subunit II [Burkholderia pseudomallei K42]KGX55371.1 cytochrome c oxidase subunit II [Burkholderia pseudomallei TSV44]